MVNEAIAMSTVHKNDVGTTFRWTVFEDSAVDVSAATVKQVKFVRPDSTQLTKTLSFSTKSGDKGDGSDGRVEYVSVANDINQKGTYKWALHLSFPAAIATAAWTGDSWYGTFTVEDVLF